MSRLKSIAGDPRYRAQIEEPTRDDLEQSDEMEAVPQEFVEINGWVRAALDRRLTLAVVAPAGSEGERFSQLCLSLAAYPEVRVFVQVAERGPTAEMASRALTEAAAVDPDVILVWMPGDARASQPEDSASLPALKWPREALGAAERMGLCERAFVVLIGVGVTRADARRMGYEDGFPLDTPTQKLMRTIVGEAIAREQMRRHGSSPPCYL